MTYRIRSDGVMFGEIAFQTSITKQRERFREWRSLSSNVTELASKCEKT